MLIKYMSVVPEWAREVLDVLIFIASESVASVISVIALNLKAFKIFKKTKLFCLKTGTTLKKNFAQKVSRGCIFTDAKAKEIQWRQKLICSKTSFL